MIIDTHISVQVTPKNKHHYEGLGYGPLKMWQELLIEMKHLKPQSQAIVMCSCDSCFDVFERTYQRITTNRTNYGFDLCHACSRIRIGAKNKQNPEWRKNVITAREAASGDKHPRWNPNKREFIAFLRRVHWLTTKTYRVHKEEINPNNHKRTYNGVDGGWQLDHIVSIREAFDLGWSPEMCAHHSNLQMLPWEKNRAKWYTSSEGAIS